MHTYLIAYDFHGKPPEAYEGIVNALKEAQAQHAQYSVWVLASPYSAKENYEWLQKYLSHGDELVVAEVNTGNTWLTLETDTSSAFEMTHFVKLLRSAFKIGPDMK
jgi:peptidyl-tRNA hydrolase